MIFAAPFSGTLSSGISGTVHPEYSFNRILTEKGNNIKELIICDPTPEPVIENLNRFLEKHNNIKIKNYNGFEDFVKNGMKNEII